MMQKTYELICHLPAQEALERIKALLSEESVKYRVGDLSVSSTRTPIILFSVQPQVYSHNNFVGVNPFVFVSGVEVLFEPRDGGLTVVTVRIDRRRAYEWVAVWVFGALGIGFNMPAPAGPIVAIVVASGAWFGTVSFLGGYLVKKEISSRLKDQ